LFQLDRWTAKDILINIALYVPLGASAYLALRARKAETLAAAAAIATAAAVSLTVEFIQRWEPGRVPNVVDVLTNTTGGLAGTVLAAAASRYLAFQHDRERRADAAAVSLLVVMGAWLLVPFFPVSGRTALLAKINTLLAAPFEWLGFVSVMAIWVVAGHLLRAVVSRWALPVLAAATLLLPAQLFIVTRHPTLSDFAGALTGCILFASGAGRLTSAFTLIVAVVVGGLMPLHTGDGTHPFSWIPFGGFLRQDWQGAIQVMMQKVLYYGAAIWSLNRSGVDGVLATTCVAGLLAVTEAAQTLLPGRTPEITDPILAVLLGFVLVIRQRNRSMPPHTRRDKLVTRM
jgi:VanZ family protein